jgi:hypothetical protein
VLTQFSGTKRTRAVLDQLQPARAERVHRHEPLVGEVGLDHLAGAVAARHLQLVLLRLDERARSSRSASTALRAAKRSSRGTFRARWR